MHARRQPWTAAWLGAAVFALVLAGWQRWGRMRAIDTTVHASQVLMRAMERGNLEDDEVRRLEDLGLDAVTARFLDGDYGELLDQLGELQRSSTPDVRLVSPRSATTDLRPPLRFALARSAVRAERFVRLETSEGSVLAEWPVPRTAYTEDVLELESELPLTPGSRYLWSVSNAEGFPEAVATFRVVDPAHVEARLAALKPSGDRALDVLLQSATVLASELAEPALAILRSFPKDASPSLQRARLLLEARALLLLGQPEEAGERLHQLDADTMPPAPLSR